MSWVDPASSEGMDAAAAVLEQRAAEEREPGDATPESDPVEPPGPVPVTEPSPDHKDANAPTEGPPNEADPVAFDPSDASTWAFGPDELSEDEPALTITREEALRMARFERWLQENPDVNQAIVGVLSGDYELTPKEAAALAATAPPAPGPLTPPDGLDLEDPATKWVWDQLQAQQAVIASTQEALAQHEAQLRTQSETSVNSLITRARKSFQSEHALTDEQMNAVHQIASNVVNIDTLINSPVNPFTGAPQKPDPLAGIEQAYDIALYTIPELRNAEYARLASTQAEDRKRQGKLNALAGTSGSTPKPTAPANDPAERKRQLVEELAAKMSGNNVTI